MTATMAINQWWIIDFIIWLVGLGGESNALSSLLCVPTLILVWIKNEWDISHSRWEISHEGCNNYHRKQGIRNTGA
jgi:hypothetical protein